MKRPSCVVITMFVENVLPFLSSKPPDWCFKCRKMIRMWWFWQVQVPRRFGRRFLRINWNYSQWKLKWMWLHPRENHVVDWTCMPNTKYRKTTHRKQIETRFNCVLFISFSVGAASTNAGFAAFSINQVILEPDFCPMFDVQPALHIIRQNKPAWAICDKGGLNSTELKQYVTARSDTGAACVLAFCCSSVSINSFRAQEMSDSTF